MKLLNFIPLFFFFMSCNPSYLIVNKIELDSKQDIYISQKILAQEVTNYELTASITFNKSYRRNNTGWVGFLLNADKIDGLHGKDSGYLFFIRENGEIGVDSSPRTYKEISKNNRLPKFKNGERIDLKIINTDSELDIYLNGKPYFNFKNLKLNGNYISANIGGASASIYIKSLKAI